MQAVTTANSRPETRQATSPPTPTPPLRSSWLVGLVEAETNTCTVTFNSDSETREEAVALTEDTCSPVDSGSTLVGGDVNMNFDYAVSNHWLCSFSGAVGQWLKHLRTLWTDTAASVETNATETEGEKQDSSFFSRGRPGGEYTANRKETIVNQNVECLTHAVPHISSIRLDLSIALRRWPSWAPVPNKPMVSVDVKQHSTKIWARIRLTAYVSA